MSRMAKCLELDTEARRRLEELSRNGNNKSRTVLRSKILLMCADGYRIKDIASKFDICSNTVINRRKAYELHGLESLYDNTRAGRPRRYDDSFREQLLNVIDSESPPDGLACWDGGSLAKRLGCTPDAVWRCLKKEGICLSRQRSWCVSTDPEFSSKSASIIGLYLNPPENAIVLSVDEKPSIQALERETGYVKTSNGKIVRGLKSTYKRNGTLNLFAALNVATGVVLGKTTQYKKRPDFIEFMDEVVAEYDQETEIHVILDNYCIHKRNDEWLNKHPNVTFHYTPTSASWLNQVEIWFGIMTRKALRGASFEGADKLSEAIKKFIDGYNKNAKPFVWRKREVKGAQIKDNIKNLRN